MTFLRNIVLGSDSYKFSHANMYPPGTKFISSYIEPRYSKEFDDVVFFGLQYFLQEYLSRRITEADVKIAQRIITAHGEPFNYEGWMKIVNEKNGMLPVEIQALPEGTVTGLGIPQVQIVNTDPEFFWLTSFLETSLLRAVWYPSTVATKSRHIKKIIKQYLDETSDDTNAEINFKLHDFGMRGASSAETAALGGAAHLINFMGTDTVNGLELILGYYSCHEDEEIAGFSIPATEHSTITSWGKENEVEAYRNLLQQYPTGLVACVSDSYDIYNAVDKLWGEELKLEVLKRDGVLVIRPDSGDPIDTPIKIIEILGKKFGTKTNSKGYLVLNDKVRVIQGDGINEVAVNRILWNLKMKGYSASNISFGMGGALLQNVNRDTLGYAMKANAIDIGSGWVDVYKDPIDGTKTSKKGRQAVIFEDGVYKAIRENELGNRENQLKTVFKNGVVTSLTTKWATIRERAKI